MISKIIANDRLKVFICAEIEAQFVEISNPHWEFLKKSTMDEKQNPKVELIYATGFINSGHSEI